MNGNWKAYDAWKSGQPERARKRQAETQKWNRIEKFVGRINNLIMILFIVLLVGIPMLYPYLGSLAIRLNDGGILAALGLWSPPRTPADGIYISPFFFMVWVIVTCLGTRYFLSPSWKNAAGQDNAIWFMSVFMTLVGAMLTPLCMLTRYMAWWHSA